MPRAYPRFTTHCFFLKSSPGRFWCIFLYFFLFPGLCPVHPAVELPSPGVLWREVYVVLREHGETVHRTHCCESWKRCPSHPTVLFMRPRGRNMSVSFRGGVILPSGCLACIFNLVLWCSNSGQFSPESAAPHNQHARAACRSRTAVSVSVFTLACHLPCLHWSSYFKLYFRFCCHLSFIRFLSFSLCVCLIAFVCVCPPQECPVTGGQRALNPLSQHTVSS